MKSHATPRFWRLFHALPEEVQRLAVRNFRMWQANPSHPSLRYRRLEGKEDYPNNSFTFRITSKASAT
jgi:hypothetical protein